MGTARRPRRGEEHHRDDDESQDAPRQAIDRQVVVTPWGEAVPFAIDARKKTALREGLDEIALTNRRQAEITAWQGRDRAARPWAWDSVA